MDHVCARKQGWQSHMEGTVMDAADNKPLMRDFWTKFRRRTYIFITVAQITTVVGVLVIMEFTNLMNVGWIGVAVIGFIMTALLNAVTVTLIHLLGRPFHDLVQAVVLVSGEPTADKPPNPNSYDNKNDGFKEILQTVYEMSTNSSVASTTPAAQVDNVLSEGINTMSSGVVILDSDRKIVYHNGHAPVKPGIDDNPILEVFFPEDDTLENWLANSVKNKLTDERHWGRVANKLPGERDRQIFDVAASYRKGSAAETVLVFFDQSNAYLPEEDDLDFISFAAHELRGPITVIRGYLEVIEEELQGVLQPEQLELMTRLTVTSNRLTSYINNILNAAKYDRRHLKLHLAEESLHHIYSTIADDVQLRASSQNRVLSVDIPDTLPTVAADANSVGEVIVNLLDNAIKYSNEGGQIQVTARAVTGFVEISVIDRGIGMPSNIMQHLFHKFYRSHRSRETVAGTGIGLYICKAIVSSHGGTIAATSIENEGSTFSFTLPIYDTVAAKLQAGDNNNNVSLIEHGSGWIKNHSMYRE